ncbi:glycerophosphoryl diester phosphodiesterase [Sphingobium cloacae]|uniref:Glycerophosphoryl diester phosphodiesterase n=2 Tax=Sphingobium cloacae TaxID=120107 RepID=A0A1E1F3T4_9SPHN|nr:glycerophosphoryl diester phosphodiesterase [Sphingobium cloacae]
MSGPKPDRRAFLTARPFAHRGLHGAGVSENGMTAFDAAIAGGYGIECDVRLSRDGVAMVFHDAKLDWMTAASGPVAERGAAELESIALRDGGGVPRLSTLLDRCADGTPLLVEIKIDHGRDIAPLCAAVADALARSSAPSVAVMSFHPLAMRWFARHAPDAVRGLVVTQQDKPKWRGWIERALALALARPDFIACDIRDLPSPFAAAFRQRGLPVLTWTVRSAADRARAAAHADQIIFERVDG